MPELSGYKATKIIRNSKTNSKIPIIALTAHATKSEKQKFGHVFDDYITKPFTEETLRNSIAKILKFKKNIQTDNINEKTLSKAEKDETEIFSDEFILVFNEQISPLYKETLEKSSILSFKKFAFKTEGIAKEYNVQSLKILSKQLLESINLFNLDEIKKVMSEFQEKYSEITDIN